MPFWRSNFGEGQGADFTLEVIGRNLMEEKKKAFEEDAGAVLTPLVPKKPRERIARLLGIKANTRQRIALQFNELSLAVSDPFDMGPSAAGSVIEHIAF